MEIISLIISVLALCGCAFLFLERLNIIRIVQNKDFRQYYRNTPDDMLGKQQNTPQATKKSTFRGT